jgi:serine/threonine protein kinase
MDSKFNEKKYNKIAYRIESIQDLVKDKNVESIVDYAVNSEDIDSASGSEDIRHLLPKKYLDFNTTIKQLGGKLLYIKSGSTGHTFKGVHPEGDEDKLNYAVKVVAYPKKENYGDLFNVKRPENAELLMIRLLSYFVRNNQTPHIVLPMTTFNTSIKPFLSLPKNNIVNNKKFDQFIKRYKKGEYYENVSVLISEWANGGDLLDYIRNNYKKFKLNTWRTLFFQFLSVLAIIQAKYPGFRHNDLKANNLLVNEIATADTSSKFQYKINGQSYVVPNIGFQVKLWDFDFACIPGLVENSKVDAEWTSKINIEPVKNRYYDVHYFFNTLTKKGFFPQFWTEPEIPTRVKDFVNRVVPEKFRKGDLVSDRGRILTNEEYLTPDEILKTDKLFKIMRIE